MFVPADQRDAIRAGLQNVISSGQSAEWEMPSIGPDKKVTWYWTRGGPLRHDGAVVGVLLIARDLTEKKQSENQLLMSDRMASVGMLAAGIAHEINNPLAAVTANLEMTISDLDTLPSDLPVVNDLREQLTAARTAAERVRQIVLDLGVFSRFQDDARGAVNVERVLELALRMSANEVRHRAQLVKKFEKTPPVIANESQLGQVFLHLVVNAAQSIPVGSALTNEIRVATGVDGQGRVVVTVSDTGVGIPVDVQEQMFTPFFTGKTAGLGIGLPQCRRIVSALGGELSFKSEIGCGTSFHVAIPAAKLDAPVVANPRRSASTATRVRRGSVLVIDDESMITSAVQRILASDHEVTIENAARAALSRLQSGERYDDILCDLMMPQMTGVEFFAELTALDPGQASRVVFLTGGAFSPNTIAFLESTTNPRMEKPFNIQNLRALVGELIQ